MKKLITALLTATLLIVSIAFAADTLEDGAKADREFYLLIKPLALKGDADAQGNFGLMYYLGRGVTQDYVEAVKWLKLAAKQGNAVAQTNLGNIYIGGKGVTQDYVEAVKWYKLAAAQGNAEAQFFLSAMFYEGKGVAKDYVAAHMWLNLAGAKGDERVREIRDLIQKEMTQQEIAQAQKLARECLARNYKGC
jgi:TPR repeat protein